MQLHAEPISLVLSTPFRIAHGASTSRDNVFVHVDEGVGVAAITPYYPAQVPDVLAYIARPEVAAALEGDPLLLEDLLDRLPSGPAPARAAIDLALHDRWGTALGQPLYRLWGLNPERAPLSSYTISMANDAEFRQRVRDAAGYPVLKIKLGSGSLERDEALVRMAREEYKGLLCVDANAAWAADEAANIIPGLAQYDLQFIEQPVGQHDREGWQTLAKRLPEGMPPLIADESIHDSRDILPLAGAIGGINIKLAKCGGLREARRMIALARCLGMKVMLGCMIESIVGVTAAAHLAPLVDFADLDGNLLVINDPYTGMIWDHGRLHLPAAPGLGVQRRNN